MLSVLSLRGRLSATRHVAIERMLESDVRWRSLGGLFAAGGVLTMLSLALPTATGTSTPAVAVTGVVAAVLGTIMVAAAGALPTADRWLSLALALGTVLITAVVCFNQDPASPYALIYVWVGFDGFFFLTRRAAWRHLAFVGVAYAFAMWVTRHHGTALAGRWLLTTGTVGVVGVLADLLRERSERLIGRLTDAARTDALTGLLNRRGFEEVMDNELERAARAGRRVSVLVGDLDHFKLINDRFGHQRGDQALQEFSVLAMTTKRRIDSAARIGGEEFALVLPDTDEHGAYLLAERLRRRVSSSLSGYGRPISISFGVATYPRHGDTPEAILRSGDQALYLAKRLGRDRSVIFSAEVAASLRGETRPRAAPVEQVPAVLVLAEALDLRDASTALHSQTVGRYAEMIAVALGLPADRVERIRLAGLLHDIGKIGIADPILRKAGRLTEGEHAEMRKHPELGARIVAAANLDDVSAWVRAHHERPDGGGYPAGLAGDEIPLEARILAVADAFEAMTSDRVYSDSMPVADAEEELRRHAGSQFDAHVVEVFLGCLRDDAARLAPYEKATSAAVATPSATPATAKPVSTELRGPT
jgi:diguanylate cyclase (GGDEF)-like protein/putative nucleotidyltransferase with HDIG domain